MSVVIASNTSSQSTNSQAYATLDNNNNIDQSIKKACPSYEGNKDIEDLVTDILNACLPYSNQPPTSPNPNPTKFDKNIMSFEGLAGTSAKFVINDTNSQRSNSYDVGTEDFVQDEFVIPVGDRYQITATPRDSTANVTFESTECQQVAPNICTGTMGTSKIFVQVEVKPRD